MAERHDADPGRAGRPGAGPPRAAARPSLPTRVVIEAALSGGRLDSAVWVGGSLLCARKVPLPAEVTGVWDALDLPPEVAAGRMAAAGRRLADALLDERAGQALAGLIGRLPPGDSAEVVLVADGLALALPAELLLLPGAAVALALLPAVSVSRRPAGAGMVPGQAAPAEAVPPPGPAGPLKILAAVAAPDETRTQNAPLDVEAEMQAVLDAVAAAGGAAQVQVRVLEVASLGAIRQALEADAYHVLHLSAHGSADLVELEDEDGGPAAVSPDALVRALQQAGRAVPLIVLASCSGGSRGSQAMAAELARRGTSRVIAMLAPVTDGYATTLARHLYAQLASRPGLSAGQALARARYLAEESRAAAAKDRLPRPEYGVPTLITSAGDGPLADPAAPAEPLSIRTTPPAGRGVRELPMGALIGRRAQLRQVMAVLRRDQAAVARSGVASGVVLTGTGGIGKTALAGRVTSRLRDEGWLVAVHEGAWNPTALIAAAAGAIGQALDDAPGQPRAGPLGQARRRLADPASDDAPKLAVITALLGTSRLLVVLDDFEQNLAPGGGAFLDPAAEEALAALAAAAETGALLVTCRYPLPGPDRFLVTVGVPPLSDAELGRLFLRLPALEGLDPDDQRLLGRAIGGHPRLIEFADALLRGGRSSLRHVQGRLRDLAAARSIDLTAARPLTAAVEQAMMLGSADILLDELTGLLTPAQASALAQVAVSRAPMAIEDLAFALAGTAAPGASPDPPGEDPPAPGQLRSDVDRLADLTLLTAGSGIVMHPWTAELITRSSADLTARHEQALAMRLRRFGQGRGDYGDLLEIPRHLAALQRWDDVAGIAGQAVRRLPGTQATLAYLAQTRPLIPAAERAWAVVADLEIQALLSTGNLQAATRLQLAIHQQFSARAAADPSNAEWQRDLSVSHDRIGDTARAAGDLSAARAAYQAGLDIARRLAAGDPSNSQRQRDLSVSHIKVGDTIRAAGDLTAARAAYQAGLDIRQRLAASDPSNAQWQRDLSVSHERLGDTARADGDLSAARAAYQAGLDIAQRLAAADPSSAERQRDLSVSHNHVGDTARAAGDLAAARAAYRAGLDIAERLAAADPSNTEWQRDLSVSQEKIGDTAVAAGDFSAARAAYRAGLDIAERLAAADPSNTEWQRDLSVSYERVGDAAVAAGDLAAARAAYRAGLDIRQRLAASDPSNAQWQRDLSVSHERIDSVTSATAVSPVTPAADPGEAPRSSG
jgi:tetratricopeptide (TPR) repeat protein